MTIPEVGGLIEFCRCEADAYGAVIGLGHKVRIVDEAGGELAVEFRHVKYAAAGFFDPSITAHQAASRLTQTLGRARALASDVKSVESLWGSLSGGPPLSLADLCRHLFGPESGRVEMLGARMLLRAHGIFFREGEAACTYAPRSATQVAAMQRLERALTSSGEPSETLREQVSGLLKEEDPQSRADCLALLAGWPAGKQALDLLERYALEGLRFSGSAKAERLMRRLCRGGGAAASLAGAGPERALNLLVKLGHIEGGGDHACRRGQLDLGWPQNLIALASLRTEELTFDTAEHRGVKAGRGDREDFTRARVLTIDEAGAKDLDDALSVRRLEGGGVEVAIHIADVDRAVSSEHPLEGEARRRGVSVYLPTGTLPMFPHALSEGAMSLAEGKVRPALSFVFTFNDDHTPRCSRICLSWVKPARRFTYTGADAELKESVGPFGDDLRTLREVASASRARRLAAGAVVMQIPEARAKKRGAADVELWLLEPRASHTIVQEMMILASETAGRYCRDAGIPAIYRGQLGPVKAVDRKMISGKVLPLEVAMGCRKLMRRATLSGAPCGHFGLGLDVYAPVTSPIRRYGDLVVQRQIKAHLCGEGLVYDKESLRELTSALDKTISAVSKAEREAKRFWSMTYYRTRVGSTFSACVVSFLDKKRALVWMEGTGVTTVVKRGADVVLGGAVTVRIKRADPRMGKLDLVLLR